MDNKSRAQSLDYKIAAQMPSSHNNVAASTKLQFQEPLRLSDYLDAVLQSNCIYSFIFLGQRIGSANLLYVKATLTLLPTLIFCLAAIGLQSWDLLSSLIYGSLLSGLALSSINCSDKIIDNKSIQTKVSFAEITLACFFSLSLYTLLFPQDLSLTIILLPMFCATVYRGINLIIVKKKTDSKELVLIVLTLLLCPALAITTHFDFSAIATLRLLTITAGSLWFLRKFITNVTRDGETYQNESKIEALRRDSNTLATLMKAAPSIVFNQPIANEIIFGNKNAKLQLTVLTNPNDPKCALVVDRILILMAGHRENLKVIMRFKIDASETDSASFVICSRLLEIYRDYGEKITLEAYALWLKKPDLKRWLALYDPPKFDSSSTLKTLHCQSVWIKENHFIDTPVVLLNDKIVSELYTCEEIMALLPLLTAHK
ncbi:MAG: hypothetical protein WBG71_12465 [Leeuwenhoekiella sp.]